MKKDKELLERVWQRATKMRGLLFEMLKDVGLCSLEKSRQR